MKNRVSGGVSDYGYNQDPPPSKKKNRTGNSLGPSIGPLDNTSCPEPGHWTEIQNLTLSTPRNGRLLESSLQNGSPARAGMLLGFWVSGFIALGSARKL